MKFLELIKENYGINLLPKDVEFINIDLTSDSLYFIDPFKIARRGDSISKSMKEKVLVFFQTFLKDIISGNSNSYLDAFHEINVTRLGYSNNSMAGKGIGPELASIMIRNIEKSKAFKTGLVSHIEDLTIFFRGVSNDRISDLITNIIIMDLIEFTQEFCTKNNIIMSVAHKVKFFDLNEKKLKSCKEMLPLDNKGRGIILVPKIVANYRNVLLKGARDFYWMGIIPHLNSKASLFQLLTGSEIKEKQSKIATDQLLKAKFNNTETEEFATDYLNEYDPQRESMTIYKNKREENI